MKKTKYPFTIIFLTIIMLNIFSGMPISASRTVTIEAVFGQTKFTVNGEPLTQDSLLYNGTAYLPAAYLARRVGLDARWDSAANVTYLSYSYRAPEKMQVTSAALKEPETKKIQVTFGAPKYYLNGIPLEQESLTYNGTAYLPASFLAQAMGLNAVWNPTTNITNISFTPVSQVSFLDNEITVDRYSKIQLNPVIFPENASVKRMCYSSNNENIVTVNENGEIYAQNEGEATITCISVNGVSTQIKIKVIIPVTHIFVYQERNRYQTGETAEFRVEILPVDATDKIYTLSANGETMNSNRLQCLTSGQVTVTAAASNGINGSVNITIIDLQEYAAEVVRLTNEARWQEGASVLSASNANLNGSALIRADELIKLYSHTRPNGTTPFTVLSEKGVKYSTAGENIAMGQTTPEEVITAWLNSPGHRKNIMNLNYNAIGVGVSMDERGGLYWVQLFIG